MSIKEVIAYYIQCDHVQITPPDLCMETYPSTRPVSSLTIQELLNSAGNSGWFVVARNEGLKGISALTYCPDHNPDKKPITFVGTEAAAARIEELAEKWKDPQ